MKQNFNPLLILIGGAVLALVLFGYLLIGGDKSPNESNSIATSTRPVATTTVSTLPEGQVQYACADEKVFVAWYTGAETNIALRDDQIIPLSQVSTDSERGVQFGNATEKLTLWAKGDTATVEQNGTTTYSGCTVI